MIQQPNNWSCLPTALSILLDESFETLIQELGHDGSEVVRNAVLKHKGFHIDEVVDLCLKHGFALLTISALPGSIEEGQEVYVWHEMTATERLDKYMEKYDGLLIGPTALNGFYHACAWKDKKCYNPADGKIYQIHELPLQIDTFHPLVRIANQNQIIESPSKILQI